MFHIPTELAINGKFADDLDTNLLGTFNSMDMYLEPLRIFKTIYIPTTLVWFLLKQDITPGEAWTRFCDAIVAGGQEVDFSP